MSADGTTIGSGPSRVLLVNPMRLSAAAVLACNFSRASIYHIHAYFGQREFT